MIAVTRVSLAAFTFSLDEIVGMLIELSEGTLPMTDVADEIAVPDEAWGTSQKIDVRCPAVGGDRDADLVAMVLQQSQRGSPEDAEEMDVANVMSPGQWDDMPHHLPELMEQALSPTDDTPATEAEPVARSRRRQDTASAVEVLLERTALNGEDQGTWLNKMPLPIEEGCCRDGLLDTSRSEHFVLAGVTHEMIVGDQAVDLEAASPDLAAALFPLPLPIESLLERKTRLTAVREGPTVKHAFVWPHRTIPTMTGTEAQGGEGGMTAVVIAEVEFHLKTSLTVCPKRPFTRGCFWRVPLGRKCSL